MWLTSTEYTNAYSKVLKTFAASQTTSWQESIYKVRKGYKPNQGKLLFLYAYALSTWEHNDSAENYLTEKQVLAIISKVNQTQWS